MVAASSVEAEYIAQACCVREALWVCRMLADFALPLEAVDLRADNMCAAKVAKDFENNFGTKHIDIA